MVISQILTQLILRMTFGGGLALAVLPPRLATARTYRLGLAVLAVLNVVAAVLVTFQRAAFGNWLGILAMAGAGACVGGLAGAWSRDSRSGVGTTGASVVAMLAAVAALLALPWRPPMSGWGVTLAVTDLLSSGLLFGITGSVLLLGSWYLQTPAMELVPLRRLVPVVAAAASVRTLLVGAALLGLGTGPADWAARFWLFLGLRWACAVLGLWMLALLARETARPLKEQTAAASLFIGLLLTFVGELTAQLVPVDMLYPL